MSKREIESKSKETYKVACIIQENLHPAREPFVFSVHEKTTFGMLFSALIKYSYSESEPQPIGVSFFHGGKFNLLGVKAGNEAELFNKTVAQLALEYSIDIKFAKKPPIYFYTREDLSSEQNIFAAWKVWAATWEIWKKWDTLLQPINVSSTHSRSAKRKPYSAETPRKKRLYYGRVFSGRVDTPTPPPTAVTSKKFS